MNREIEVRHLNKAGARIADTERHITAQKLLVERLGMTTRDSREAEYMLETMEMLLAACYEHHRQIVEMIERIDAGLVEGWVGTGRPSAVGTGCCASATGCRRLSLSPRAGDPGRWWARGHATGL